MLSTITTWASNHWEIISLVALLLVQIAQTATKHWSSHTGAVKVLLFIVNLLSPLTSRDEPGWLKALNKPVLKSVLLPFALAIGLLSSSGCASLPLQIDRADTAIAKASPALMGFMHAQCSAEATKCGPVGSAQCPAWKTCDTARTAIKLSLDSAQTAGLEAMTLSTLGKAADAKAKLEIARKALQRAYDMAKAAGVL